MNRDPPSSADDADALGGALNRCRRCRHGFLLYNVNDLHIGRALELYGEWAEAELELLGLFLQGGDVVVDVGANIGTHTVCFAGKVGPAGKVLAFEPQRIVFQMLCANAALNGLGNVHALHAAAGAAPGTLRVPPVSYVTPGNYGGVSLRATDDAQAAGESVPVLALDDLGIERCKVLKIDVEGMELAVLDGARSLIARTAPIIYVENNDAARSPALIGRLLEHGYHLFWHFSRFYNPDNYLANPDNVFGNVGDINMICVAAALAPAFHGFPRVEGPSDTFEALQRRLADSRR